MHLDHKIPWNALANYLTIIRSNTSLTPHSTDLFWNQGWGQRATTEKLEIEKVIKHFSLVFLSTIREFSSSKRKVNDELPMGKLFSDALLEFAEQRYDLLEHRTNSANHNPLSKQHQDIEYWHSRAMNDGDDKPTFSTADADLADAVKMLITLASVPTTSSLETSIAQEALTALHRLSSDPRIPLQDLDNLSWGHSMGINMIARPALEIYIIINSYAAVDEQGKNKNAVSLLELESLLGVLSRDALQDYDYPAQNILHRAFWHNLGVKHDWLCRQKSSDELDKWVQGSDEQMIIDPLAKSDDEVVRRAREALQVYLKTCFAVLYMYDIMLCRWYGDESADAFWMEEIGYSCQRLRRRR